MRVLGAAWAGVSVSAPHGAPRPPTQTARGDAWPWGRLSGGGHVGLRDIEGRFRTGGWGFPDG